MAYVVMATVLEATSWKPVGLLIRMILIIIYYLMSREASDLGQPTSYYSITVIMPYYYLRSNTNGLLE